MLQLVRHRLLDMSEAAGESRVITGEQHVSKHQGIHDESEHIGVSLHIVRDDVDTEEKNSAGDKRW